MKSSETTKTRTAYKSVINRDYNAKLSQINAYLSRIKAKRLQKRVIFGNQFKICEQKRDFCNITALLSQNISIVTFAKNRKA